MKKTANAAARERSRLSREFYPFLIMISCFSLLQLVYSTFLSTYTLAVTGSARNVKIFNIILAACQPVSMIAAVVMIRRVSAIRTQQLGLMLIVLVNVYLLADVENAANNIYWVSAVQSIANGFYFTTYACQYVSYTTNENRDRAAGLTNLVTNALSLAFSIGSSLLFSFCPDAAGYRILFLISFVISLAALAISFKLSPLDALGSDRRVYYLHAHRVLMGDKWARASMVVSMIDGMRAGVLTFFLNILLYSMIDSEALVGLNTFLTMLCGIVASALYARFVHVETRYRSAQLSIAAMLLVTLGLIVRMSPTTIILYGAFNALMLPFYSTPLINVYWTVLEKVPGLSFCRAETHAAREVYYGLGRIIGVALTLVLPATGMGSAIVLLCLMATQYLGLYLSRGIMRDLDKTPI